MQEAGVFKKSGKENFNSLEGFEYNADVQQNKEHEKLLDVKSTISKNSGSINALVE